MARGPAAAGLRRPRLRPDCTRPVIPPRPMKTRALLLAAACAAFALVSSAADRPPLLAKGTAAPDFTAQRPDNSPVKLSDFRGKVVLVDFWSTWCGPCKATMPHMEKLHKKLEAQGLVVLGVCVW